MVFEMKPKEREAKIPKEFKPSDARKIFYRFLKMTEVPASVTQVPTPKYDHIGIMRFLKSNGLTQYQQYAIKWAKVFISNSDPTVLQIVTGSNPGYKTEEEIFADPVPNVVESNQEIDQPMQETISI